MKKQQQVVWNEESKQALEQFKEGLNEMNLIKSPVRLRTCFAMVYENERYIYLRSYNTIIAFIDKEDGRLYDVLRLVYGFTATSAQHIAKFKQDYFKYWCVDIRYKEV